MYVVVEINGQQFKAEQGKKLFVQHIQNAENGAVVEFDKVLLVDNEGEVKVGAPLVEGAKVVCEVVSHLVKGKKVLVIHPFEESIRSQYARREKLFPGNSDILPEFELKTIKAVQSLADNKDTLPFKTWFEALKSMTDQIDKTDFDIAIIGAGAYGLPLGAHCKRIGKQAIHLGGATQLLFGIMGRRWENYNSFTDKYVNEYWIRPSESERPKGAEKVEGACYF